MSCRARLAPSLLGLVAVAVLDGGCARTHLFYDTRELRHRPLAARDEQAIVATLVERLQGRRIVLVDEDGRERVIPADSAGLSHLGRAETGALWLATASGEVGGEHDVRVQLAGKPAPSSVAVSVLVDLDGSIRIVSPRRGGGERARRDEPPPSEEGRTTYGLAGKLPGRWAETERRALDESLAALAPAELEVVRDVHFDRQPRPRDRNPARAALFEMKGCRAFIFLFSSGVRSDHFRFVGDASAPRSAVLHSLIHEIGHAFEQAPARERYCAAISAPGNRAHELVREGNDLVERSPVLAAYLEVLAGEPAPTDYGNSSRHESFAESFALFHVDPAALLRTRPRVHAWFARGGHVEALGRPRRPPS